LAAPIAGDDPCGPDLEYDVESLDLAQLEAGRPRTQFTPAEPPDWPNVHRSAMSLLRRTKDLRVAVVLARAATRTEG
ncbi:type VI secretion system ImpA family N-terminal domain-containing protein, partial [Escherichia coli]|uniref:type VI secretion system ImpA family N-terminal domain-containing protein n=1 Tax=Escherichia coli TaxID=562 RepID=UPI0028DE94E2